MPLGHLCWHCGRLTEGRHDCDCPGATAAAIERQRRQQLDDRRRHLNQTRAGRNTSHWRKLSNARKALDGFRCTLCQRHVSELPSNETLTVHLLDYMNGDHRAATIDDCRTLCSSCHGVRDGGKKKRQW